MGVGFNEWYCCGFLYFVCEKPFAEILYGTGCVHVVHRLTCRLLSELLCTYTDDAGMHLIPQRLLSLKNLKVEEKIICI